MSPLSRPTFETEFAERKRGGRQSYTVAWSRPDSGAVRTTLHHLPLVDPAGKLLGSLAIVNDRSELDRLADDLAASNRIVEDAGIIVYRARLAPDFPVEYISDSVR